MKTIESDTKHSNGRVHRHNHKLVSASRAQTIASKKWKKKWLKAGKALP